MAKKGEVDLVIRAKNEATKNLEAINKALKDLADRQKIAGDSAGQTDSKLAQLGTQLAQLRTHAQNLKSLSSIEEVLDKGSRALSRQRDASDEAGKSLKDLVQKQKELTGNLNTASQAVVKATTDYEAQQRALKASRSELSGLNKEATALRNAEARLGNQLVTSANQLATREAALVTATEKQQRLSAELAKSERVTKTQQNSLDAATRAVERRRVAVEQTLEKEAAQRQELEATRKAAERNKSAIEASKVALETQQVATDKAKSSLAGYKTEVSSLNASQRKLTTQLERAGVAVEKQKTTLAQVQAEYDQLKAASDQAKTSIAGSVKATDKAGSSAARAAVQVAVLTAKMAAMSGGGSQKAPAVFDPKSIQDADKQLRNVAGTIKAANDEASKASVSVDELNTAIKDTGKAKTALEGIADSLKRQDREVKIAHDSWKAAEKEVRRLAIAMREAGEPSEALASAFGRAQGTARKAKTEFLNNAKAAEQSADALQKAGIGTGTLSSAQAALSPRITAATRQMKDAEAAASKMGTAVRKAGDDTKAADPPVNKLTGSLVSLGRAADRADKMVSPVRRLRNELVSLAATSVGIYALKQQLVSIWDAGADLENLRSKYTSAFGTISDGAEELEYAQEVAVNLKLPIDRLADSYVNLALAAHGTELEGERTRKIFEGFAQVARANRAGVEETEGMFRAISHVMSKGVGSIRDLEMMLGRHMPGSMQLFADVVGVSSDKLREMISNGEITRDVLMNVAAAASQRVAPALEQSLDSPAAKLMAFQNQVVVFKRTVAESGFLDAVADGFERMGDALSTPEAADAAERLGAALADMVTWAVELVSSGNLETIVTILKSLVLVWASLKALSLIPFLVSLASSIASVTAAVKVLWVALSPLIVSLGAVGAAVAVVVALFVGWKLAQWAYDNFPAFAQGVMEVKKAFVEAFDVIKTVSGNVLLWLGSTFDKSIAGIRAAWYKLIDAILNSYPRLTKFLGMGDLAKEVAAQAEQASKRLNDIDAKYLKDKEKLHGDYEARAAQREEDLLDQMAAYHADRIDEIDSKENQLEKKREERAARAAKRDKNAGLDVIVADKPFVPSTAKADRVAAAAAERERLTLEKNVASQMFAIRAQLEKKTARTLDEQLAAIPAKYAKLYSQLEKLGKGRTSEEWKTVDALVAQEQALLKEKVLKEQAAAKEKEFNDARKAEMQQIETLLRTRRNLQEQLARAQEDGKDNDAMETLKERIAGVTDEAREAIEALRGVWLAVDNEAADIAISKLDALKLKLVDAKDEGILTADTIANAFTGKLSSSINTFIDNIAETGNVLGSLKDAFRQFAIMFLKQIAQMIMQQMIFNAISGMLGGATSGATAGSVGGLISGLFHEGGTVGSGNMTRSGVNPAIFQNAMKYHGGGIAGLKSDEVPAILKMGETVRTQEQEKALAEKQSRAASASQSSSPIRIVNQIDSGEMVAAGIGSASGEEAFLNFIGANRDSVKRLLG